MDSTAAQHTTSASTAGNVIAINNNDLIQQRTSVGNGQQVFINENEKKFFIIESYSLRKYYRIKE